jgi:signal transduction histidine kinase
VGNNLLDNPAVGGIVVNASDVTETRRLAASLVQSQKLEAVGRLAGGVAHDFNNLLTAISGYAEALLTDLPDDSEHRDDVVELARAAGRATTLVQQLLTYGRKQPTQPTVLDVRDVVSSMEPMLRQMLGSAVGLACGGPRLPANVTVDRSQLEQVLLNLVVNARDACEAATSQEDGGQAGGQIVIRTESVDLDRAALVDVPGAAPGRYVVLSVRDDGCGMDGATREQVLEPFFTTKRDQGTGFGLSIVHGIVSEHGGHVTVQSEPGQGTTVRVALPESVEAEDPLSVAERSAAEPFRTSA